MAFKSDKQRRWAYSEGWLKSTKSYSSKNDNKKITKEVVGTIHKHQQKPIILKTRFKPVKKKKVL